jgi:hypothetical protein
LQNTDFLSCIAAAKNQAYSYEERLPVVFMIRRCLLLLVIAGMLASQLAALPHAHAGLSANEQKEHDATPHVHCTSGHRHHHSHVNHLHQRSAPPKTAEDSHQNLPQDGVQQETHDATAIYCPQFIATKYSSQERASSLANCFSQLCVEIRHLAAVPQVVVLCADWRHPPDAVQDDSHLYLTLRTLRI